MIKPQNQDVCPVSVLVFNGFILDVISNIQYNNNTMVVENVL